MQKLGLGRYSRVVSGSFTEQGGHRAALGLLARRPPPTAIIAANDLSAIGALNGIEESGLEVPKNVSLVGYDNTWLAGLRHISLTTVNQPRFEMGQLATSTLLERVELGRSESRHAVLPPSLVIRKTTGPPPSRAGGKA